MECKVNGKELERVGVQQDFIDIEIDTGVKNYRINKDKILSFNPTDPNFFSRLEELEKVASDLDKRTNKKLKSIELKYKNKEKSEKNQIEQSKEGHRVLRKADLEIKQMLSCAFGKQNDFDDIFNGVSLMAIGRNGEMIVMNFIHEIKKIIEPELEEYSKGLAIEKAKKLKNK